MRPKLILFTLALGSMLSVSACGGRPILASKSKESGSKPATGSTIDNFTSYCDTTDSVEIAYTVRRLKKRLAVGSCADLQVALNSAVNLTIDGEGIRNIDFLAFFPNITSLSLIRNSIVDISVLAKLPLLRSLDLSFNQLKDIEPLTQLSDLRQLGISANPLESFSAFSQMKKLNFLKASDCNFKNLEPLSGLTALETLSIAANGITDLIPLKNLSKLKVLDISKNRDLTQIDSITKISSITALRFAETKIYDLSFLSLMPQLKEISLIPRGDMVLDPITKLTHLQTLTIQSLNDATGPLNYAFLNVIAPQLDSLTIIDGSSFDLSFVPNLTNATSFSLQSTSTLPLASLANLTKLKVLEAYFSSCDATTTLALPVIETFRVTFVACPFVTPFRNLTTLKELELDFTPFAFKSSVASLSGLKSLENLTLTFTELTDLNFVASMPKLKSLHLYGSVLNDFSPLTKLSGLKDLSIAQNRDVAIDIEVLSGISTLESLVLQESPLAKHPSFAKMPPTLKKLEIYKTTLNDCTILSSLKNLTSLSLRDIGLADFSCVSDLSNLEYLNLSENAAMTELPNVKALADLRDIFISNTGIKSISGLGSTIFLRVAELNSTGVVSLDPLKSSARLGIVKAFDTPFYIDPTTKAKLCVQTDLNQGLSDFCKL